MSDEVYFTPSGKRFHENAACITGTVYHTTVSRCAEAGRGPCGNCVGQSTTSTYEQLRGRHG